MDMQAVEFQGRVENGLIQVPESYREDLDGQYIRVIVMKPTPELRTPDIIDELIKSPAKFKGVPLTREEIYNRGI